MKSVIGMQPNVKLTKHAKERAVSRLGMGEPYAENNIRSLLNTAYYRGITNSIHGKALVFDHFRTNTRIITDQEFEKVITVYKIPGKLSEDGEEVDTNFLRPALERELRKLNRFYTRSIRQTELEYAHALRELSDMAINRARARNPKTRELIAERMSDKQADIDGLLTEIERMNDEWQAKKRAIEVIAE